MIEKLEAFIRYITYEKRYSKHTIGAYERDVKRLFQFLNDIYLINSVKEIEFFHLRSWVVQLIEEGLSPKSVQSKIASIKSFFKFLLRERIIEKNPTSKLIAPKSSKRLPEYVEEDHVENLLEDLVFPIGFIGCRDKTILELLYASGIRRAELIGLKITDIEFTGKTITVLGKRNKYRIIPLSDLMLNQLEIYINEREATFPLCEYQSLFLTEKGKPLYPKLVYNVVKKYLSMVTTTKKRGPHTLRHTFATHLSNRGADLNAIKELLGHANLSATQIYVHNSIDRLRKVYEQTHPKAKDQDKS